MYIATITSDEPGRTDQLLAEVADALMGGGLRVAGVVQTNFDCPGRKHCEMDVRVLPDGPDIPISQQLGKGARGCRLDPGALETAVAQVEARFSDDVDILILNKFGKHEAEGRGFRALIAKALERRIPVLTGVNRLNAAAFDRFTEGMAKPLPAEVAQVLSWCQAHLPRVSA